MVLLVVIGEVLRAADSDAPERVSQRHYDAARATAGHPDSPRADKLAARFGVGWPVLRDRVLNADHPAAAISHASKTQTRRVLTRTAAAAAVTRVAAREGLTQLSPTAYEQGRTRLNDAARMRHVHGAHLLPLPAATVIEESHGFRMIVEAAGLSLPDAVTRSLLDRATAVIAFVEHFGFRPYALDVQWMGRQHGIQLVQKTKSPHSVAVADARAHFETLGRWFPPAASRDARPDDWQPLGDGAAGLAALARAHPRKRTRGEGYMLADLRDAITRAYDLLPVGQHLTADRYRALLGEHDLPSYNALHRRSKTFGTHFAALVHDEATRRAAATRRE